MERPKLTGLKDKSILEYIEHLEAQLKTPYAKAYISIKKIADNVGSQLEKLQFNIDSEDIGKDLKKAGQISSQLKDFYVEMDYYSSKMSPEEVKAAEKGVVKEEGVEQFLKTQKSKS